MVLMGHPLTLMIMMNEVSKYVAQLNAQSVMAAAVLFGHGDSITLSCNSTAIVLTLVYDDAWFDYEREIDWLSDRIMCGCNHWLMPGSVAHTSTICVSWNFNPNLK